MIAAEIRRLRIMSGYSSYEKFANEHDIDRKQYWRIENGANFTLKTLIKILNAHNISFEDFFRNL